MIDTDGVPHLPKLGRALGKNISLKHIGHTQMQYFTHIMNL